MIENQYGCLPSVYLSGTRTSVFNFGTGPSLFWNKDGLIPEDMFVLQHLRRNILIGLADMCKIICIQLTYYFKKTVFLIKKSCIYAKKN